MDTALVEGLLNIFLHRLLLGNGKWVNLSIGHWLTGLLHSPLMYEEVVDQLVGRRRPKNGSSRVVSPQESGSLSFQ